jgi:hypothetical protein
MRLKLRLPSLSAIWLITFLVIAALYLLNFYRFMSDTGPLTALKLARIAGICWPPLGVFMGIV